MPTATDRQLQDWVRHDVSSVAPLGSYAAKRCPVRTQWDVLQPAAPLPPPDSLAALFAGGNDHEGDAIELLGAALGDFVALAATDDRAAWEAATAAAMADGAPLIVNGRLPVDEAGRRTGVPDLLVRAGDAPVAGRWRYRPADIKQHLMLRDGDDKGIPVVVRPFDDPWLDRVPEPAGLPRHGRRSRKDDLLQLAHYHRMLEACGHAADGPGWGAILGTEGLFVWLPLDEPLWTTPSTSGARRTAKRTSLEHYDFEFGFRLDIAAVAHQHLGDPATAPPLLVEPMQCKECETCPWRAHCGELLDERQDVSLLPGVTFDQWAVHRQRGVATLPELAALDPDTAALFGDGVQLADLVERASDRPADTPLADLVPRRKAQLGTLADAGITTVGDLAPLDDATATYGDAKRTWLPEQIDLARARLGPEPVYRRRGVAAVEVPRGDIEIDLDMENAPDDGVYLWGVHVVDRAGTGLVQDGYQPFVTWEPVVVGPAEERLFTEFWRWLTDLRARAERAGRTVTTYCWSLGAERRRLLALGDAVGVADEVAAFLRGGIVDLRKVVADQLVTGYPMGLKDVAPLAGHTWQDDDPGGLQSLQWWQEAVAGEDGPAARDRVLTYNRDDVVATAAIRDWLAADADRFPSVAAAVPDPPTAGR